MQQLGEPWRGMLLLLAVVVCATSTTHASFLPSVKPRQYKSGETITAVANSLISFEGEHLKHDYYDLPFCKPQGGARLQGHKGSQSGSDMFPQKRVFTTPYNFEIKVGEHLEDWTQKTLNACPDGGSAGPLTADQAQAMKDAIGNSTGPRYRTQLELDGLPVSTWDLVKPLSAFRPGFDLGAPAISCNWSPDGYEWIPLDADGCFFVFNHLAFNVLVHKSDAASSQKGLQWEVVGFEVMPCSIKRERGGVVYDVPCAPWGESSNPEPQRIYEGADIIYTYDVYFSEVGIPWHSRWSAYSNFPRSMQRLRMCVIGESLLVAAVLALAVAMVCRRSRRASALERHGRLQMSDVSKADAIRTDWVTHEEVFRLPYALKLLSVLFGAGTHMLCAAAAVLGLFMIGALSPEGRHAWLALTTAAYLLTSASAGYSSVLLLRHLHRDSSLVAVGVAAKAALLFPGMAQAALALRYLIRLQADMHTSVPGTEQDRFLETLAVWYQPACTCFILAMLGTLASSLQLYIWPIASATATATAPTLGGSLEISRNRFTTWQWCLCLAAGVLPCCALYLEACWLADVLEGYLYHISWSAFAAPALTAAITAQLSVLCTHIQLRAGSPHWWWRSFAQGAVLATPLCLRGVLHATLSGMTSSQALLYLCYTLVAGGAVAVCFGVVSLSASLVFVCWVYNAPATESHYAREVLGIDGQVVGK